MAAAPSQPALNGAQLTLHHLDHSRSLRVIWLLEHLGIPYDLKSYKRGADKLAPKELKQAHPLGHAPVLDIEKDGVKKSLVESGAIMISAVERFAPSSGLLPGTDDPNRRYDVLYWVEYAEASIMSPLMYAVVFAQVPKQAPFFVRPLLSGVSAAVMGIFVNPLVKQHLAYVEEALSKSDGDWICGKDLTLADFMMSFPLDGARKQWLEKDAAKYPRTLAYLDRIEAEPAMRRAVEKGGRNNFSIFL